MRVLIELFIVNKPYLLGPGALFLKLNEGIASSLKYLFVIFGRKSVENISFSST